MLDSTEGQTVDRERRLFELMVSYVQVIDAGGTPDPQAIIEQAPDLANELESFFENYDQIRRELEPLRDAARLAGHALSTLKASSKAEGRMTGITTQAEFHPRDFGRYILIREIARGGMGVIYEATQRDLKRVVALKMILNGRFSSPNEILRFRAEAEAVAALDHPAIVPVYEVGEHDGFHYFTMKRIYGESLARSLDLFVGNGPGAARLVAKVARAVHHAHHRGVLHRDLKPSNILIDPDGQPHVIDFGLAKRLVGEPGDHAELTATGAVLGTPGYLSPEQVEGRKGAVTTLTDVYGLGAILYALLTGRPPVAGDSLGEILDRIRRESPEPLRRVVPRIDHELETICLKCLEKEPERRYSAADALADDLERWLAGESIAARPTGALDRLKRWCLRIDRVRDAGLVLMVIGMIMASFCIVMLILMLFSDLGFPHPAMARIHGIRCIIFWYLPMAVFGWQITRYRVWAIWSGMIHSALLGLFMALALCNVFVLDYRIDDFAQERGGRLAFELMCLILFTFEIIICVNALIAYYVHRRKIGLRRPLTSMESK